MNEIQELLNEIESEQQKLENLQVDKQCMFVILDNKRNHLNSLVDWYKETFLTVEDASSRIQHLNDIKRRLSNLQAVPVQTIYLEIERLKSEATPLYFKVKIDTEAPEISTEEMKHMFRVIEHGYIWEDKDKTIHNLRQKFNECSLHDTVTEFKPPDSYVADPQLHPIYMQSIQREEYQEDCEQFSVRNNCTEQDITQLQHDIARLHEELQKSKQMNLKLENEAQTREQDVDRLKQSLHSLSEELVQTKADPERIDDRNVSNNKFVGATLVFNCSSEDMTLQVGTLCRIKYRAENVQHNPQETDNTIDGGNVSYNNFCGATLVFNCTSKDLAIQLGNQTWMKYRAENVQHNPRDTENTIDGRNVTDHSFCGATIVFNSSSEDMGLQFGNQTRMMYRPENVQHNPQEMEN